MNSSARTPRDATETRPGVPGAGLDVRMIHTAGGGIVCATDFSAGAAAAAEVAARIARARSGELLLVHPIGGDGTETAIAASARALENEAQRLAGLGGQVRALGLDGSDRVKAFIRHLEAEPPSLVVVSSDVMGPFECGAGRSFADALVQSSPVPILVMRNPAAFASWDWINRRLRILLALDLHATSDAVLRWAGNFRLTGPCDLAACYFPESHEKDGAEGDGGGVANDALQADGPVRRELQKKIRDLLGDDTFDMVIKPCRGDPAQCIAATAAEWKADLVAVAAHQRHGLSRIGHPSVSRALLLYPGLNVVCVPGAARFDPREAHVPEFRRVLVATDLSELGNAAIPYACAACAPGGTLRIIHVTKPRIGALREGGTGWPTDLHAALRALIPKEAGGRIRVAEAEVVESCDIPDAICQDAERFGADVVCLASRGPGASRKLSGSVANAVLKKLRRAALVVRRPDP